VQEHPSQDELVLPRADAESLADYATLRRGIGYQREVIAWCRVLANLDRITAK
jgi:Virulence activator alpha C-term